ncbi:MAG TPA: D-alanyl-D-alanine carboxypeptidase family protein [Alphaproteobacteria bacterium]|nr:D-alanyl-D-alanine carboxypeptidase family protein [Alphaproteobacteria bacterium]HQS93410.1 D-alanyl-D-alanine carboxypeptidase family protein [Alphaproteobacteria bacterium]
MTTSAFFKTFRFTLLVMASLFFRTFSGEANVELDASHKDIVQSPKKSEEVTLDLTATTIFLMDAQTGEVLFSKNGDVPMSPSSMSKVMTVYMVFEKLKGGSLTLDTTFPVSEKAWRMQGSKMFVDLGSQIRLDDLLRGIVVQSGNDACIVVAEALAGTEDNFARQMTKRAHELGATSSNFTNSTGWEEADHKMTARDIATIALKTIQDFPEYYSYYSEIDFTYNGIKQGNRNPLLYKNIGCDGLKTGHTDDGGFGLVASAVREGRRLIMVINGCPSMKARSKDAEILMNWGFREFDNVILAKPGQVIEVVPVWMGKTGEVGLYSQEGVVVTLKSLEKDKVKATLFYETPLNAPIIQGAYVGEMRVAQPNGETKTFPLQADRTVEELGFFGKLWFKIKSFIPGL